MKEEIKIIWTKALELGFDFNATDSHEMWIAIRDYQRSKKEDK